VSCCQCTTALVNRSSRWTSWLPPVGVGIWCLRQCSSELTVHEGLGPAGGRQTWTTTMTRVTLMMIATQSTVLTRTMTMITIMTLIKMVIPILIRTLTMTQMITTMMMPTMTRNIEGRSMRLQGGRRILALSTMTSCLK
jgi:hypothetical protein